jgi:hypothetical protein
MVCDIAFYNFEPGHEFAIGVRSRAGLDGKDKINIFCPCSGSNPEVGN